MKLITKVNLLILLILFNGISYAGTNNFPLIIVGGSHGTILMSLDGVHWRMQKSEVLKQIASFSIESISHNNTNRTNSYTALAFSGVEGEALMSPDGVNWTIKNIQIRHSYQYYPYPLLVSDETKHQFLSINLDQGDIYTSYDGWNWKKRFSSYPDSYNSIAISNSIPKIYLAAGRMLPSFSSKDCPGVAATSTDGTNWSKISNQSSCFNSVVWGKNQFVASAVKGALNPAYFESGVLTSPDGKTWKWNPIPDGKNRLIGKIIWANNMYLALGLGSKDDKSHGGTCLIYTSPDGVNWTVHPTGINYPYLLTDIAWINNMYIIVGGHGTIATSRDAIHWTAQSSGTNEDLLSIA